MANIIGPRLKAFRDSLGLTQGEFGDKCGISQRTYANLESGKTQKVSTDYLTQIERAFPDLSAKWLRQGIGPMLREVRPSMPEHLEEGQLTTQLPMMGIHRGLESMTDAEQIAYWKARYEKEARLRQEEREAKEHEETLRLVKTLGGKALASLDAAEDDYTPPAMVAETNHEYNEMPAIPEPVRRMIGFEYGLARLV